MTKNDQKIFKKVKKFDQILAFPSLTISGFESFLPEFPGWAKNCSKLVTWGGRSEALKSLSSDQSRVKPGPSLKNFKKFDHFWNPSFDQVLA